MQDPHQSERHTPTTALAEFQRPLAVIIRLSALGDVLLTASAIQALSRTHDVLFVTEPAYVDVVARLPGVTATRGLPRQDGWQGAGALGWALRALHPSITFDLQGKVRSQLLARFIGGPVRTLHRRTWGQTLGALFGNDTVINDEHQSLRYQRHVGMGAELTTGTTMSLDPAWIAEARRLAEAAGWGEGDLPVAIAPAATHVTKGWGPGRYAELVRQHVADGTPLLLVGGPRDTAAIRHFQEALGPWVKVLDSSAATLTTLAALLARCRLLIGNDSGPIHLAALLGIPTLAVFGPTAPVRWGALPGSEAQHRVVSLGLACAPCSNHGGPECPLGHHDCLKKLPIERVAHELGLLEAVLPTSAVAPHSPPRP
jgi:heptosyltransferase-2